MTPAEYRAQAAVFEAAGDRRRAAGQRAAASRIERAAGGATPPAPARRVSRVISTRWAEIAASIPVPSGEDGYAATRAGAGTRPDGTWAAYWLVGTQREWIDHPVKDGSEAIALSAALNARLDS